MSKGYLITFEGGDGCGKSTHFKLFLDFLTQNNIDFVSAREPGATPFAECIREMTKSPKYADKSALSELLLFETSRADLTEKVILPALNKGKIVVLDRFYDSTLAYQGYGRGFDIETIKLLNKIAAFNIVPNLTFWFNLDPELAFARNGGADENDVMEIAGLEFHKRVQNGYKQILKENPNRVVEIVPNGDILETQQKVRDIFCERFKVS